MQTPGPDDQALHDYSAVHDYLDDAADDNDEGHDDDVAGADKFGTKPYYVKHWAEYDGINHYHDAIDHDDLRKFVVEYLHRLDDFGRAVDAGEFGGVWHLVAAVDDAERALRSAVDGG